MSFMIESFVNKHGETLYNVPAEVSILVGMGFSQKEAADVCNKAIKDAKFSSIRAQRDYMISQTDYTQMPDSPLSDAKKKAWADYRQALRDLPQQYDNPDDVVWPTKPE